MPRSIITLTTDFGAGSSYVAQMKGVILSLNPEVTIVDITHSVLPHDIRHGGRALEDASRWFPEGTIHVAVVDPGVGTERRILYARVGKQRYIAPDNGLLGAVVANDEPTELISLTNREFWLSDVSATFHGRDIMAPVAAYLSLGLEAEKLGEPAGEIVAPVWPEVKGQARRIEGMVVSFDAFGNLITDITAEMLRAAGGRRITARCGNYETRGLVRTYAERPPQTLIALIGSSRMLELAVVNGSAAKKISAVPGDKVIVTW
jgi:hypothetical protein